MLICKKLPLDIHIEILELLEPTDLQNLIAADKGFVNIVKHLGRGTGLSLPVVDVKTRETRLSLAFDIVRSSTPSAINGAHTFG